MEDAPKNKPLPAPPFTPREPVGLLAGSGRFPFAFAEKARGLGIPVVCVGIRHEASPELAALVDRFYWSGVARMGRMIRCFRKSGVRQKVAAVKTEWLGRWKKYLEDDGEAISPYRVIHELNRNLDLENSIVTHDAGAPRDQIVPFYTERLGFRLVQQAGSVFATVSRGDLHLLLSGPGSSGSRPMPDGRKQEPGGWNRIVLYVASIDATIADLQRAGVRFRNAIEAGPGGKQIQLEDPDGNPIELHEAPR